MFDAIEPFSDAIRTAGLVPPDQIQADGELHRFSTNGKVTDDSGWYVLHTNGIPSGAFGCWRQGINQTWSARKPADMTPQEREQHQHALTQTKCQRAVDCHRRHAEARARAARIWHEATPESGEHRYLRAKGINAYGIRTDGQRLVVPMRDTDGTLHSIQYIDPTGDKRFLFGGDPKGHYCAIGKPHGTLCICEGYATGASLYAATGHAVAVAFNAGNLEPVARALRAKFSDLQLILCADDDVNTKGNPGLAKATAAAHAVGGLLAVPLFGAERIEGATDFNDLAQCSGLAVVQRAITDAKPPAKDQDQPANSTPADDTETFRRLAKLSPIEYDRCRDQEAKRLGVRVATLDDEVKRLRPQSNTDTEAGSSVLFNEPEPWPEPVDGAALLNALAETFSRYVVLPAGAAHALALWTAHTHVYSGFEYTPRLNVKAPDKGCGKTLLLDVLQTLIAKGLRTENVSTAVLFRLTDSDMPSLLIDEYDSFLRDNEELRGALNAGQKRGGVFLRCVGDNHEVRAFKVFAPVALASGHYRAR